jgi:SAM-dependent methyltransferase
MDSKDEHIRDYQRSYPTVPFEPILVRYRQAFLVERLHTWHPTSVVEVGCGLESLYERYLADHAPVDAWVTVEPSPLFLQHEAARRLPHQVLLGGFFEDTVAAVHDRLPHGPDVIVMAGVLHEVKDPQDLLRAAAALMKTHTILHVSVPNAHSLHRQLARAMGLIDDVTTPSAINEALGQPRVYTRVHLQEELRSAGFTILQSGGYFLKPFTHAQMAQLRDQLGTALLDGLFRLGQWHPDMASEIYCDACLA